MVDDSGKALESSDTPAVAVESVVRATGTQLVIGCVANATLGTIVAVGIAVTLVPGEGNPETFWSMFMNWVLAALAVAGFASAVWMGRRASLRPEYGLRGDCLVLRTKKQDWHTLIELGDVEEISLTLSDAIAETHYVSLEHGGKSTTIGPFEKAVGWATIVAARAGEIRGTEVIVDV